MIRMHKLLALAGALSLAAPAVHAQTAADSGWRPLFNGTNFNGLYVYAVGTGVVNIPLDSAVVKIGNQTNTNAMFRVDSGRIRVNGSPNGYIGSVRQYSHYRLRVQYMWPTGTSSSANAGMLVHIDSAQVRAAGFNNSNNRPRSIEVNMKRDQNHPMSLWAAQNLGPTITSYVQDSSIAIPLYVPTGGIAWVANPSNKRTIASSLSNPELPLGQWNQGEYLLRGADSGVFTLNGQVRTRGYDFRNAATSAAAASAPKYSRGNVVLQSEGATIYYRNFEIQELDSITGLPLHATTSVLARMARSPERRASWITHDGGITPLRFPEGFSRAELYNLRGKRVALIRGRDARRVPAGTEKGLLFARFLP
ncbi:MAG: Cytochrome c [Fibrobacteria bacterium]|nr:Cytochrome c [Fibrobacteria bacterium]